MSEGDAPDPPPQRLVRPDRRRAYRLARAANAALGAPPEDVAVELIAFERGARVVDADLTGVDAMLVRAGAKAEILVSRRLPLRDHHEAQRSLHAVLSRRHTKASAGPGLPPKRPALRLVKNPPDEG